MTSDGYQTNAELIRSDFGCFVILRDLSNHIVLTQIIMLRGDTGMILVNFHEKIFLFQCIPKSFKFHLMI